MSQDTPTVTVITGDKHGKPNFANIWRFRELIFQFAQRDLKARYKQTILGFGWAILQPVVLMLVFTFVFKKGLKVPSDGIPYPIFAYSGLLIWKIFSFGIIKISSSILSNISIIRKIHFPIIVLPFSTIVIALFDFLMATTVFVVLILYYHHTVVLWKLLVFMPLSVLLTIITTVGMGCFFAAINAWYRDFRYMVPFLVQILLFVNPIVYPSSIFTGTWSQHLIALNPMAGAINMARYGLVDAPLNFTLVGISMLMGVVFFVAGIYLYKATEHYIVDIV